MVHRHTALVLIMAAFLFAPVTARGDDADEWKAAFDQTVAAFNKRDLDAYLAQWREQLVIFVADSPFPTEGKAAWRQGVQAFFDNHSSATFTPMNPHFRVNGDSGLAWGYYVFVIKPKDGPLHSTYGRATVTGTRVEGKWLLETMHLSAFPSGD